jgi:hypothetical protein
MKYASAILLSALLALVSCATTPTNSIYQSVAPEVRGERAISSAIELVSEVELETAFLGVFYSKEVYQNGEAQNILFALRGNSVVSKPRGRISDYSLRATSSLGADQARKLLSAIDEYLAKDPATVKPAQMYNFELYSGIVDMSKGSENYRPFAELTFSVIFSVTNSGKSFKTVFPYTVTSLYGYTSTGYMTYDLTMAQVQKLRDAIKAGLDKVTPTPAPEVVKPST